MPGILIAESGSTKTDWCLLKNGAGAILKQTQGINPHIQTPEQIRALLDTELCWDFATYPLKSIYFYGAGTGSPQKKTLLESLIREWAPRSQCEIHDDLMAAARGLCGSEPGMVLILGTGSNAGYYNGQMLTPSYISLGYIAGDEGSGNHLGKQILQHMAYGRFDPELQASFYRMFPPSIEEIVRQLYASPFPNRYLAQFVPFLSAHRGHGQVENMIEESLTQFITLHKLKSESNPRAPWHFTGSVAFAFRDKVREIVEKQSLLLGAITASPLEGLIRYHAGNGVSF